MILGSLNFKICFFLKGDGNEPRFYLADDDFAPRGTASMTHYKTILPDQFIQVHRSYIVNKDKVNSRQGNYLIVRSVHAPDGWYKVPIGRKYLSIIETDQQLGLSLIHI